MVLFKKNWRRIGGDKQVSSFLTMPSSLVCIYSEDPNLVHIGELGNNKHYHSNSVEKEHWMSIVCCV
ncbi:hypothetical protein OIU76_005657 [Salix suchowensis]|uniref:Uncharacterized protein n=1 Tax=Salix koriyanagi TaxID=2511006 RepID=A0A9Q0Z6N6_9ROSI|nr:hypothetical protein OIU78_015545 [Salix suchowensis]KAJ6343958.1 hypothetical protein OIU76_005657 [Salix suchowensis]KAJ6723118.1 hypothetical protein OIU74_007666 [Salix koriyanagi]